MNSEPYFSIIIAVYNAEQYIIETLESVYNQTYPDYEVIIINDASTDETFNLIVDYIKDKHKFKCYKNLKNIGVAESRNLGFERATGKFIALLDGDDIWKSNKLKKQYELLKATGVDITYTSYELIDSNSNRLDKIYYTRIKLSYDSLLKENYIGCSSAVIRTCIAKKILMDSNYAHEDYAFWLECLRKKYRGQGLLEPLMKYRILNNSRSHNKLHAAINRWRVIRIREKLSFLKSVYVMICYILNGIEKYWIAAKEK